MSMNNVLTISTPRNLTIDEICLAKPYLLVDITEVDAFSSGEAGYYVTFHTGDVRRIEGRVWVSSLYGAVTPGVEYGLNIEELEGRTPHIAIDTDDEGVFIGTVKQVWNR